MTTHAALKLRARAPVGEPLGSPVAPSPRTPARIPHRYPDPRVGRTVVQEPAPLERDQPLHERRSLRVLPVPLVLLRGPKERRVRARDQLERIAGVVQRLSPRIQLRRKSPVSKLAALAPVRQQAN